VTEGENKERRCAGQGFTPAVFLFCPKNIFPKQRKFTQFVVKNAGKHNILCPKNFFKKMQKNCKKPLILLGFYSIIIGRVQEKGVFMPIFGAQTARYAMTREVAAVRRFFR
jgi:hypothetical protein